MFSKLRWLSKVKYAYVGHCLFSWRIKVVKGTRLTEWLRFLFLIGHVAALVDELNAIEQQLFLIVGV